MEEFQPCWSSGSFLRSLNKFFTWEEASDVVLVAGEGQPSEQHRVVFTPRLSWFLQDLLSVAVCHLIHWKRNRNSHLSSNKMETLSIILQPKSGIIFVSTESNVIVTPFCKDGTVQCFLWTFKAFLGNYFPLCCIKSNRSPQL